MKSLRKHSHKTASDCQSRASVSAPDDELLKVCQVAALLKVHPISIYRAIARRAMPHYKIPAVGVRFRRSEIQTFIDNERRA